MAGPGAPLGNQNAAKGRPWLAAINRALAARSLVDQRDALDNLAEQLLAQAATGDMAALKELGDRLDGKPTQTIDARVTTDTSQWRQEADELIEHIRERAKSVPSLD